MPMPHGRDALCTGRYRLRFSPVLSVDDDLLAQSGSRPLNRYSTGHARGADGECFDEELPAPIRILAGRRPNLFDRQRPRAIQVAAAA